MSPRCLALALGTVLLCACPPKDTGVDDSAEGDTDADTDADSDTDADADSDADADTDADSDADADTDADSDADSDSDIDPAMLGAWERVVTSPDYTVTMVWTGRGDGTCDFEIVEDPSGPIPCTFTAADGTFTIEDENCGPAVGTYGYAIAEPVVDMALVSDDCRERAGIIEGEWTRVR